MNKEYVSGYISVKSILESQSREIYTIILDKERYEKINNSNFHETEKRQYKILENSKNEIIFLSNEEFEKYGFGKTSGGIAAEVGERKTISLEEALKNEYAYYTILDGIEDPYNFGYAIRSLYAAGVDLVFLPERNYLNSTETVVRASAGASELIKCCVVEDLTKVCEKLKEKHVSLYSTALTGKAKDMNSIRFKKPLCIIYGGEKRGISTKILELCDAVIKIKYPRNCHYSLPACNAISIISFNAGYKINRG